MLDINHNSPSFQIRENAPVFLFTLSYKTGVSQWPDKCVLILHDHWRNQNDRNAIFVKKELCSPNTTDMTHISFTSSWVVNISESWILVRFIEMTEMVSAWVNHTLLKLGVLASVSPFCSLCSSFIYSSLYLIYSSLYLIFSSLYLIYSEKNILWYPR